MSDAIARTRPRPGSCRINDTRKAPAIFFRSWPTIVMSQRGNGIPNPVEQTEVQVVDGELEPRRGHCASPACHPGTTQSCEGRRFHNVTSRLRR
jgi:hypothetical protein